MKLLLTFIAFLTTALSYAQPPFRQVIETDSSKIEIIRNSLYRVYEETYKYKDSVWYHVSFIDDTTRLNTKGWHSKEGQYWGIWKEYNREGQLMYTWDHDRNTCIVNSKLYPHHKLLELMKVKADNIIADAYGQVFLKEHVKFNYNCYAYRGHRGESANDTIWDEDYVGSWIEPFKNKPNSFLLRYEVRLNKKDQHYVELGLLLDSNGKYVPSADDLSNNYGFEKVETKNKKFILNKNRAITIVKGRGLIVTDTSEIDEFLTWENYRKGEFYNGRFIYYISNLRKKELYQKSPDRKGIIFRYDVYYFNPWSGEFLGIKKMKSKREWGEDSGYSTGLVADND